MRLSCTLFLLEQLLVLLVDVFDILLVLDLERVEVDELQVVSHLFFVLYLRFSF